ncbi:MAG: STAS domain-containing protein [Candidatus Krumholzibacteria bacterium]|nr:STAS domain-containing protein [Candidatus Krumholzibacteria bacterium]
MSLEISRTEHESGACVFKLVGRLDATEAPLAYDRITGQIEDRNNVVLDLEGVEYISSGGLSIIIRLVHHLRDQGGELHLAAPQPFVKRVFDIVSFEAILKLFDDVESALEAF